MISLDKIKYTHATVAVCCVANCGSGMLIIWQFQPELFFALDVIRFILWAYALSLPWLFCHYVDSSVILDIKEDEKSAYKLFVISSVFTVIGIAVVTAITRFVGWGLAGFLTGAVMWILLVHLAGKVAQYQDEKEAKAKTALSSETPVIVQPAPKRQKSDKPRATSP